MSSRSCFSTKRCCPLLRYSTSTSSEVTSSISFMLRSNGMVSSSTPWSILQICIKFRSNLGPSFNNNYTVGIWIPYQSGIQMVKKSLDSKWSGFFNAIWIPDSLTIWISEKWLLSCFLILFRSYVLWRIGCMTDGLNYYLLVCYPGHGLNNKLLSGIWIANKYNFIIQMFLFFRCSNIKIPTVFDVRQKTSRIHTFSRCDMCTYLM